MVSREVIQKILEAGTQAALIHEPEHYRSAASFSPPFCSGFEELLNMAGNFCDLSTYHLFSDSGLL